MHSHIRSFLLWFHILLVFIIYHNNKIGISMLVYMVDIIQDDILIYIYDHMLFIYSPFCNDLIHHNYVELYNHLFLGLLINHSSISIEAFFRYIHINTSGMTKHNRFYSFSHYYHYYYYYYYYYCYYCYYWYYCYYCY